jgi:hypothetical protein
MSRINKKSLVDFASMIVTTLQFSLVRFGLPPASFRKVLEKFLEQEEHTVPFGTARTGKSLLTDISAYGSVLRAWRSHPKFVDKLGNPLILARTGPRPSVFGLLRSNGFRGVEDAAINYLIQSRAIERLGRNRFKLIESSSAKLSELDMTAYIHAAKCIDAYLGTLLFNLSTSKKADLLPEKKTEVLLPADLHSAYKEFAQRQLTAVAHTIDDWLEAMASGTEKNVNRYPAGAVLVAYSSAPRNRGKRKSIIQQKTRPN